MNNLRTFLNDSWRFYTSYLLSLSILVLIPTIPFNFLILIEHSVIQFEFDTTWYFFGLHAILIPLYLSTLIVFMASRIDGKSISIKAIYSKAFRFWPPMAVVYVITSIFIGVGFLALIIPGLIVMARTSYAQFYCVLENGGPIEAIKKSWNETKENQWILLIGLVVMYSAIEVPDWMASKTLTAIGAHYVFIHIVTSILNCMLFSLPIVFAFRIYSDRKATNKKLKQQEPSTDTN